MKSAIKIITVLIIVSLSGMAFSQGQEPSRDDEPVEKIMEQIAGTWRSVESTRTGADSLKEETLVLLVNARYERTSAEGTTERGSYRLQEAHGDLILEPDEQEPVSYAIQLSENKLILRREDGEMKHETAYVRTKDR